MMHPLWPCNVKHAGINPFHTTGLSLPPETSENMFSEIFRGYKRDRFISKITHSFSKHPFSTPLKHQKTVSFPDVFRGWRKSALEILVVKGLINAQTTCINNNLHFLYRVNSVRGSNTILKMNWLSVKHHLNLWGHYWQCNVKPIWRPVCYKWMIQSRIKNCSLRHNLHFSDLLKD